MSQIRITRKRGKRAEKFSQICNIFLFFIISSSPCLKALLKNFSSSILLISQENDSVKQSEMKNAGRFQLKKYDEKEKRNEKQIV